MYYAQIKDNRYLVMQEVPKPDKPSKPVPTHHILILDRSGSMSWTINPLIDNVLERVRSFKADDSVTVGYFSGEGEFRFVVKGFRIGGVYDLDAFSKVMDNLRSTLSTTCFSEILGDLKQVLTELGPLSDRFALTLFTDGCPVVRDLKKEERAIFNAIEAVSKNLTQVLLIGYGGYYNKALMTGMAGAFGGSLVHAGDIPTFAVQYEEFTKTETEERVVIPIKQELLCSPVSLHGRQVSVHTIEDDDEGRPCIKVAPNKKGRTYVYYLVDRLTRIDALSKPLSFVKDNAHIGTVSKVESMIKGAYALAYTLSQQTRVADALDILSALGDVAYMDEVTNAFTVEDYGKAEYHIGQAITFPSRRYTKGRNTSYLPKADAFCVLDALELLMSDEQAYFYPRHPDFQYKRIGRGSTPVEGYPKFEADKDAKCAFTTLTWHKELLNLSILARIPGTVDLGDEAWYYGFAQQYPTFVWRNYAIIKDGMLNTTKLPFTASYTTTMQLHDAEAVQWRLYEGDDTPVTLQLDRFLVMNRTIAEGKTSAHALCTLVKRELGLMASLKVLRWQRDKLEAPAERSVLSDVQLGFLESHGIGKNGFSPPTIQAPSTDFYYAKSFSVTARGFSSLPPVEKVLEKLDNEKPLTPAEMFMALGYQAGISDVGWFESTIKAQTAELREVRSLIQRTKFAVVLGKAWFDEFSSREESTYDLDGMLFTFKLRDDVKIEV